MRGEKVLWTYVTTDTLCHHGIKGQRWGVRRFQNRDGSLTAAGRRRYDVDIEGAKQRVADAKAEQKVAKRKYNKNTHLGLSFDLKEHDALSKANQRVLFTKDNLKNEKIKMRLNEERGISSRRLKYEEEYRNKGMSEQEAAIAAYKRARTERIIAATAAVGIVAAASYVAYRHYDRSVDKIIKSDTLLKRVTSSDTKAVRDGFYASISKKDANKYVGLYGRALEKKSGGGDVFQKTIRVKSDIKVASEKSGKKVLEQLVGNDPTFKKQLHDELESYGKTQVALINATPRKKRVVKKAVAALGKGKIDANVYQALNLRLPYHTETGTKFYDKLREMGYDAIGDVNDKRMSGYGAKSATIIANPSKVSVEGVRRLSKEEIGGNYVKENLKMISKFAVASVGTSKVYENGKNRVNMMITRRDVISEYKRKHPNTSLTYSEILDNYYKK